MASLLQGLTLAMQVAFLLLALGTLADWIRHRDRQRVYLILALLSLSLVVLAGPVSGQLRIAGGTAIDITIVLFLLSGYFLLLFRASLMPLGRRARWAITVAVAAVGVIAIAAGLPSNPNTARTTFQWFALAAAVLCWILCVGEPVVRLGLASIGRPAVEGARLRALSLGYAGLIAVLVVGTVSGSVNRNPSLAVATDIVTLLAVPLLYASFSPPVWLRRIWSHREETAIRSAMHDLLLYSPDRAALARRALEWATRLVGGAAAFIVDSDGSILAARGLSPEEAARIAAAPSHDASTVVVPLDMEQGLGRMTILAAPFIPVFGAYEVTLLRAYAVSITAGLDRVTLTGRIASLEKAKTEFLNIASHELRGPMTVIKGYLTMLAGGSLGDMSPKALSVLPLLIAKSDEVTSMLEQMVEASRLEDGKLALKIERSDITELADGAVETLQPLLTDRKLVVERPPAPVWADVDPDRFKIVVRNLVANAIKYSAQGAPVTMRISRDGDSARLAVVDEGIGIAKEDQARLFTRFGRIQNEATADTSGTGLGLWLSREIARMHDGSLTVQSEPGRGSTFTLEIPLSREESPTSARGSAPASRLTSP